MVDDVSSCPTMFRGCPRPPHVVVDFAPWGEPLRLNHPTQRRIAWHPEEVTPLLEWAESQAMAGQWVALCLTYEAGAAWNLPALPPRAGEWLAWGASFGSSAPMIFPEAPPPPALSWRLEVTETEQRRALARIDAGIRRGDFYQVNWTTAAQLSPIPDPAAFFAALHTRHRHPFSALVALGDDADEEGRHSSLTHILSFSPELLLMRQGSTLTTAPIKGTRPRGRGGEDRERAAALEASEKDRAEHVMIVDMARNDLGRVSQIGSIRVPHLFARRSFPTVHHLESRVLGEQRPGVGLAALMAALFPAASITGAPRHRVMREIAEVEGKPRGIYTGSVGVIRPGGDFIFNVAIRTVARHRDAPPRLGLGGGIVAESEPDREWEELADKARFLRQAPDPPGLIETLRIAPDGGIPWLERHLRRMGDSARALGLPWRGSEARAAVLAGAAGWRGPRESGWVVRLELTPAGECLVRCREAPILLTNGGLIVGWAEGRRDGDDPLWRHKTTRRGDFDEAMALARSRGWDEALFVNTRGGVTEGCLRSLLVKREGAWWVPPVAEGVLPGLWRAERMATLGAREAFLTVDQVRGAEEAWLGNAVRGGQRITAWGG
ncbi:MAG: bifunctional anthranilate synthase component I family protein/class IV aminotransferase [Magnetococcales bacterium]|nr:bifunctional anthranilate synthase component I family protein/class IV aminotransferase [Magnetococcales bacterium]